MNHTYRLVWNEGAQRHVPVAEVARRRGKSRGCKALARCVILLAAFLCALQGTQSLAAPTGGTVIAGQGTINQTGNTTTVRQQTQNLSLNWSSFSIAPSETVQFVQPSSTAIALNRVIGNDPSQIYGHLQANGQVFLINTNGVLFGSTAQVNVGGLVASTLNLTDADFLNGQYKFQSTPAGSSSPSTPASVINEGVINASAGSSIALLGGQVSNRGVITAQLGTVALAAGSAMTLQFSGNRLLTVQVDQGAANALAENRQLIQADGGRVIMTAAARDALLNTVVNNTGVIEARTIQNQAGEISLLGGEDGGTVSVGGTLDASAPTGGNGGNIETSGAHVQVTETAVVTTKAAQGQSGTWLIDPSDYTVAASGGDITGAALSANLNNGNVTILSSQGTATPNANNGDININDSVSWTASNVLTLTAVRNININSSITASGNTAGLVLNYGSAGNYYLNNGAQVTLSGTNPSLTIGGQVFTVINTVGVDGDTSTTTLQGMQNNLSGNYALGTDIDASATAGWTTHGGLVPIGSNSQYFDGELDGLGHTISNLTVSPSTGYAGLFGYVDGLGAIRDVNLSGGSVLVTGTNDYVGGLVGYNVGNISNSTVIMDVTGESYVGGLAGYNSGIITNSWASGTVTASSTATGGLVGYNIGIITNSHASATVIGGQQAGGLVGYNVGVISGSFATGSASASNQYAGGLVGYNIGLIEQDSAAGSATSPQDGGGLVGYNSGTIEGSNATGAVNVSNTEAGGLAGENTSTIEQSSASGSVTAPTTVGGLVGTNSGSITDSFASGTVTATGNTVNGPGFVGGLVGLNSGTISTSYYLNSTGQVDGGSGDDVGGLVGYSGGNVDQSYAITNVIGANSVGGLIGYTDSGAGTVTRSYASGSVSGTGNDIGGLIGTNNQNITGSYATNVTVSGTQVVGGLVGLNYGSIAGSYSSGTVTATNGSSGGLVGENHGSLIIDYSTANVSNQFEVTGGLVGDNWGTIYQSYATGSVVGNSYLVGGLVGVTEQGSSIVNSYATGNVTSQIKTIGAGGLAGENLGDISGSYATGNVTATATNGSFIGGLVGLNGSSGRISTSYYFNPTGQVNGGSLADVGGLVGYSSGSVDQSYATTNVTGGSSVGGLIGAAASYNGSTVTDSYATGSVSGTGGSIGGFIGTNSQDITNSYTGASVSGSGGNIGGFIGTVSGGTITSSYWIASGSTTDASAAVQLTAAQAEQSASYVNWDFSTVWRIYDGHTAPLLKFFLTPLTVTADNIPTTYNGQNYSGGLSNPTYSLSGVDTSGHLQGLAAPYSAARNAGTYTPDLWSDQQGYDITVAGGALTINPAPLTVTTSNVVKTYDGTTSAVGSAIATSGTQLFGSDALSGGTFAFTDPNAGSNKTVTVGGVTLTDGNGGNNYSVTYVDNTTSTINPAQLIVTTGNVVKTYDGTTSAAGSAIATGGTRLFGTDSLSGGAFAFTDPNAGTNKTVTVGGVTVSDGNSGNNYSVTYVDNTASTINKAALTLAATSSIKTYDGTTASSGAVAESGAATTDSVTASESYTSQNVLGVGGSTLQVNSGYTITNASGADMSGNYTIATTTAAGTINPAQLIVTTGNVVKTYDGTTIAAGSAIATGGTRLFGTDAVSGGNFAFTDPNAGTNKTVTVGGVTVSDGNSGNNYSVTYVDNTASTINKAGLTLAATSSIKTYDGTTASSGAVAETGAATTDSVTASESYTSQNVLGVGGSTLQVNSGYTITNASGADMSGNYTIATTTAAGTINPAQLIVTTGNVVKTYDGTTSAAGSAIATGGTQLFGTDSLSGGTFAFTNPNAGTNKTVTVGGATVSDGNSGNNYSVTYVDNTTSTINKASLTLAANGSTKTYDGTTASTGAVTETGAVTGDSVSATEAYASKNALGTGGSTLQVNSGYAVTNASGADMSGNYTTATTTATGTINPAQLIVTTGNVVKTYDGTTSAAGSAIATSGTQLFGTDSLSGGTFAFTNPNAGTNKTVTVGGATVSDGNSGNNYSVTYVDNTASTINKAALTLAATSSTKTYDGTTASTGTVAETGAVTGDSVNATESYASKNALGTGGSTLQVNSGYAVTDASGADMSSNYTIATTTTAGTVNPAQLIVTTGNVVKTYDGTTSAAGSAIATSGTQLFGADSLSGGTFAFTNPNAGTNKTVTVGGATVSDGNSGNNYSVTYVDNTASTINKAALTLAATSSTKTYDGTTASTGAVTETGAVTGDSLSATESYASKNALGTGGSTLQVNSGYAVTNASGADMSGNYLVATTSAAGTINPATLTVSGATAANKTYDGGVAAAVSGGNLGGVIGTDSVSLSQAGYFSDKNAGTNKSVQEIFGLTGTDAEDYILASNTAQTTASITPKTLTVAGITANSKPYDGTAAATLNTTGATMTGEVTGDSLGISAVGTFVSPNAGLNRTVTLANVTLTGADSGNYVLAAAGNESSTTANITAATLTVTADNATKVANTANPALTVTYSGFVSGESASSLTTDPIVSTTASTNSAAGTYPITPSGAADQNYTISYVPGTLTVTSDPATAITSSAGYVGALSSLGSLSSLTQLDPTAGDSGNLKSESDDSELYDGMLDIDTPKRMTEALPILALIILDKGIRLPDGVQ